MLKPVYFLYIVLAPDQFASLPSQFASELSTNERIPNRVTIATTAAASNAQDAADESGFILDFRTTTVHRTMSSREWRMVGG